MQISVERSGAVVVARMDDQKANALTFEAIARLRGVVAEASAASAPLVLVGRDGTFCAGFDLQVMRSRDPDAILAILADGESLYREMLLAPVPIVAACTGHALAGGALLLLAADWRIGRPGPSKIGLNEVRIGMALPGFAVAMAMDRLDPRLLTAATCLAEIATAERAQQMGFLDAVEPDPEAGALAVAEELAALPMEAFAGTKRRVRAELVRRLEALGPPTDGGLAGR